MKILTQQVPQLIKEEIINPEATVLIHPKEIQTKVRDKPFYRIAFRIKIIHWGVLFQIKFY